MKIIEEIKGKIKDSNLAHLLRCKVLIIELKNKIGELEKKEQKLNDEISQLRIDRNTLEEKEIKISSLALVVDSADKTLKKYISENKLLKEEKIKIENDLINKDLESKMYKIQAEEYEAQIEDLKSDRYLVRKLPAGKTPNTVKTKISKPMSARVTKYMRGEHE